jgi:uncharacterized membrane protein (UPF0127 family)
MAGRWRRRVTVAVASTALVLAAAGCAADGGSTGASSNRSVTTAVRAGVPTTARAPTGTVPVGNRTRLEGFEEVTVTVVDAAGTARTFCLLLANTQALREQGLMFVTDPTLGGYDGMLFAFEDDSDGGFWMRNTRLPLSIAYLRADGTTTATTDMAPCPDDATTCPVYPPGGTYRSAIEVPAGGLARLGISDRSRIEIGAKACAPATTAS